METDDERKARLEKMVDTTQLRSALETEKEEHKEMELTLYLFSKNTFFFLVGTIFLVILVLSPLTVRSSLTFDLLAGGPSVWRGSGGSIRP